jgi:hypothetical protein
MARRRMARRLWSRLGLRRLGPLLWRRRLLELVVRPLGMGVLTK